MKNSYRNMYTDVRVLRIKGQLSKCQLTTFYAVNSVNGISINFGLFDYKGKYTIFVTELSYVTLCKCVVLSTYSLFVFLFFRLLHCPLTMNLKAVVFSPTN